jgi:hypothetical protein
MKCEAADPTLMPAPSFSQIVAGFENGPPPLPRWRWDELKLR